MRSPDETVPVFALLALPETTPSALFGLYEVFYSVGRTWQAITGEQIGGGQLEPRILAAGNRPFTSPIGVDIVPHGDLSPADVIVVPDVAVSTGFDPRGRWTPEAQWLRQQYDAGTIICSVCTGTLLLAEAGLLSGRTATTHWSAANLLRTHYPDVTVAAERIMTPAGDGDRIVTAGGASAWEDLALYLVARFRGGEEAVRIAKIFLFGDRAEGQLPFAGAKPAPKHSDAVIAAAQRWIADNYHRRNAVAAMADRSGLTERSFSRRFRTATGYAPIEYLQTLRLEESKHLLETTGEPVDAIARDVGYTDPTFFRRLFKRKTGTTPAQYRRRFSRIARISSEMIDHFRA